MPDNNRKDNNNKESVVTTCSNYTSTINKPEKFVTSAYLFRRRISLRIPKELWRTFQKLAKLEGLSASKVLEREVIQYVKVHSRGNPQLKLTPYVDETAPQPMRVLCSYCQGALTEGKIYCQRKGLWVEGITCYSCDKNRLRKKQ